MMALSSDVLYCPAFLNMRKLVMGPEIASANGVNTRVIIFKTLSSTCMRGILRYPA